MKSKIKQLLVGVLTVAVISSNFAAALIPGAATITGTIAVTENKTVVASTTDTTVDVPVKVTFTEPVTGPHGRFSITADGATLTGIEVDSFDNANAEENPDAYVRIGDEYGDDGTNLETGTILVESAIDNKAAVVKYINLVATFTVPANTAAGTVIPVTVKGIDATNANEDNWEDLDATDGNITVTAAEPEKTVADYIANVDITNSAENQSVTGTVSYTVETTQALFSYVKGLGGEITALGLRGTWDGSDPATSTTGAYAEYQIPAGYFDYFATNGWAMPNLLQVYYTGMNIYQMADTNVRFASNVTYKLNNETIIVYAEVTSQVLMDYLRIQTEDEKSKAIVDVYDLAIATESVDVNGSSSNLEADFGPTFVPSYNLHDIKINGTVSYSAAQIKSLFSYVKGLGGEITALGLRGTWDGSDPTTSTTGAYAEYQIPAGYFDYFATNGWAMPNLLQVYYTGMNVAQFNTDVKFAASYTYKDANGVSHVEYLGDVLTYSFNDLISGDTTDLAVAYKELYNTISGE